MNEKTTVKCAWCGKEFTSCRGYHKYCSKRCRGRARYWDNRDKMINAERARYRLRRQTQLCIKDILQMPDPYTGQALYFDGLHGGGRNLICRQPDFTLGF